MNNIIGGYTFKNTNNLEIALTHSSYSFANYERLEFLGDSILDFLIADILFKNKNLTEQELTRARSNIVSEENLCSIFDTLKIKDGVRLGKSLKNITKAIKGDIVESIIGAIYLESGLDACKKFIKQNFNLEVHQNKDYKTLFQEYAQKHKYKFEYVLVKTEGPAHKLIFYIDLYVNGNKTASAKASSKIEAEKECAKMALSFMQ